MRAGEIYRVKSIAAETPGLTMHYAANRGEKRRKGQPQPVYVIMLLGREDDLEKPEIDPNKVLQYLGWTPPTPDPEPADNATVAGGLQRGQGP